MIETKILYHTVLIRCIEYNGADETVKKSDYFNGCNKVQIRNADLEWILPCHLVRREIYHGDENLDIHL